MRARSGGSIGPATSRPRGARATAGASARRCSLEALASAETHGLDPARYHLEAIRARRSSGSARNAVEIELLLTDAFVRYATEIRAGRRIPGYTRAGLGDRPRPASTRSRP